MAKKDTVIILTLLVIALLIGSPSFAKEVATDSRIQLPIPIFVSIGPHLDFSRQIGGDRVSAQLLLPPGKSPATYAPAPQQIQALSRARLFFKVGLPFEKALLIKIKALSRHPQIIDTQAGITLQPMPIGYHKELPANSNDHHQHLLTDLDPHSWLDPLLALKQATTIATALSRIDPAGEEIYLNNLSILKEKLKVLHSDLASTMKPFAGSIIFVYHPAFGYFARAYKLHQMAVELEGKRPKAKKLAEFIKNARKKKARVIFVQPQFDQKSALKIAEALNCTVIPLDPLAQDYCANLSYIAETIRKSLKVEK